MKNIEHGKIVSQATLFAFLTLMCVSMAHAAGTVIDGPTVTATNDAEGMLANIVSQLPALTRMVTAIAYVMGMGFIIASVMKFKLYGEARTMMSQQHHLTQPLVFLAVGTLLLYLPSAINSTLSTFWANPNPYGYVADERDWTRAVGQCVLVIQFFGLIAFIRGLVIISHLGGHHGGQGGLGKGVTHVIGGIFCINIYQFVKLVMFTLGLEIV